MTCKSTLVDLWPMLLTTDSETPLSIPAGKWRRLGALAAARSNFLEFSGKSGNIAGLMGVQLTNDPRNPDAATAVLVTGGASGWANANGVWNPASSLTTISSAGNTAWRPVWLAKLTTAGARGYVYAVGTLEIFESL